jgi:hypothetical protein
MRRTLPITALAAVLAFAPASAWAAGGIDVIRDCTDNGRMDDSHGDLDYQQGLDNLPSDVDEYTDCRQIITAARRRDAIAKSSSNDGGGGGGGAGGGSSSSGGSGGAAPRGEHTASKARPVGQGKPVVPPDSDLGAAPRNQFLPTPVIVALVVMGLAVLVWLVASIRARRLKLPSLLLRVVQRVFPRRA